MKIAFDGKRFFNNSSGLGNYSRDLVRILATFFLDNQYVLFNKNQSERGKEILKLANVSFVETNKGNFARQLNFLNKNHFLFYLSDTTWILVLFPILLLPNQNIHYLLRHFLTMTTFDFEIQFLLSSNY